MENTKKKNTIRNYSLLALVIIFLIGFSMINRSNDGELNDYENYEPEVVINETNETLQDSNEVSVEFLPSIFIVFITIGVIVVVMGVISNVFRMGGY